MYDPFTPSDRMIWLGLALAAVCIFFAFPTYPRFKQEDGYHLIGREWQEPFSTRNRSICHKICHRYGYCKGYTWKPDTALVAGAPGRCQLYHQVVYKERDFAAYSGVFRGRRTGRASRRLTRELPLWGPLPPRDTPEIVR